MVDDRHQVKIAIVDDDPAVLDSLQFLLESRSHDVVAYSSVADFLADQERQWHCLIVDQHMPQLTGLDLVEHLRKENKTTPVLLMTGAYSDVIGARAAALGIQKVLEKPLCSEQLEAFLEACASSGEVDALHDPERYADYQ